MSGLRLLRRPRPAAEARGAWVVHAVCPCAFAAPVGRRRALCGSTLRDQSVHDLGKPAPGDLCVVCTDVMGAGRFRCPYCSARMKT